MITLGSIDVQDYFLHTIIAAKMKPKKLNI